MNEHFVINIGRQVGSGGKAIGEIIAQRLGIQLYDKELLGMAARECGFATELFERADEQPRRGLFGGLTGMIRNTFVGDFHTENPISEESLFKVQSDVIRRLSERESCIFVGRCADYILRDNPRCVNIFLTADREDRIRRIAQRKGCSHAKVEAMLDRTDERRARYYNFYTTQKWGEARTYDLCINTSRLGDEATADLIIDFATRKLNLTNR